MYRGAAALLIALSLAGCGRTPPPSTSPTLTTGVAGGTVQMSIVAGAAVPSILVSIGGSTLNADVSRLGDFGISAAIESMSRVRGSEALVEGAIDEPGLPLPPDTIIVGGRTITVPAGTPVRRASNGGAAAALKPGVRVTGTASAAGMTAREIVIL